MLKQLTGTELKSLREAQVEVDRLKTDLKEAEDILNPLMANALQSMADNGLDRMDGEGVTLTLRKEELPTVVDWDKFYAYIKKHNAFYLLHRRVASTSWRELKETLPKKEVPGTQTFHKQSLTLKLHPTL